MHDTNYEILDCTLRDGGFYTNWDYDDEFLKQYFNIMMSLKMNQIEIGYFNPRFSDYRGEFYYLYQKTVEHIKTLINQISSSGV